MRKQAVLLVMMQVCAVFAEESLSLEAARGLGLANSRSLAQLSLSLQGVLLEGKAQTYTLLPSLSLGASASVNLWNEEGLLLPGIAENFSGALSIGVSQKLYDGGKAPVLKAINAITQEITRKEALAEYFAVLDAVDGAYYSVLEAAAALNAAEAALETAALGLSLGEIRFESGMIRSGEYLQALAEKEAKETSLHQARGALALSSLKLQSLLGLRELPPLEGLDFAAYEGLLERLGNLSQAGFEELYRALGKEALARNPAFTKAALLSRQAGESLRLAQKDYLPSFSASLSTGLNYTVPRGLEPSGGRLSLSGSIPLDFWVIGNKVAQQRLAQERAALDYRNAESALEIDLQAALLDAVSQAASVRSSRKALEYARKQVEYVMELYRLSQSSLQVLSDASALLSSSRNQLIKAQYGFLRSLALLRSLGSFERDESLHALLQGG
ncbi:MAG: TolC family protein [Treponema sp.]|jgi:outer membrane protein TolC|nr:TolC family protein [Treponema sp.]